MSYIAYIIRLAAAAPAAAAAAWLGGSSPGVTVTSRPRSRARSRSRLKMAHYMRHCIDDVNDEDGFLGEHANKAGATETGLV